MIVADTNLIAYFYLAGPHATAARATHLRDADWVAPRLWRSEFRSVLAKAARSGDLSWAETAEIVEAAEERMLGGEFDVGSAQVLRLAEASPCSAYDCEFVALAKELRVPLVTADRDVLRAFPNVAVSPEAFAKA